MENNKVVEVLQRDLNHHNELIQLRIFSCNVSKDREVVNALGKALLWKEKLDRLEKWLDDTERLVKQSNKFYENNKSNYYSARLKTIKEVRATLNHCGDLTEPRAKHSEVLL